MKKEIVDGVTVYAGLYDDEDGYTWNILIRVGGSISLYATRPGDAANYIIFDTLDGQPPNEVAQAVMARLADMAEGINALLAHLPQPV